jgi:hypothetical protein
MLKLPLLASLSTVCLLSGCVLHQICPPVQGSVVDTVTGAPIKSAKVNIQYCDSQRTSRTDNKGQFSFDAKHKAYAPFINIHVDRDWWFSLHVEADGYKPVSTGQIMGWGCRESIPHELQSGGHKMTWTGKAIVVDPIRLAPTPTKAL